MQHIQDIKQTTPEFEKLINKITSKYEPNVPKVTFKNKDVIEECEEDEELCHDPHCDEPTTYQRQDAFVEKRPKNAVNTEEYER